MLIIQRKNKWLFEYSGSDEEILFLQKCLTMKNPNAYFIGQQSNYDISSDVLFYKEKDRTIGHGVMEYFLEQVDEQRRKGKDIPNIKINDWIYEEPEIETDKRLWGHQAQAVKAGLKYKIGTIKIPTRGGKTLVTAELMRQILLENPIGRIVMLIDTVDLFKQTVADIKGFLNCDIGFISAGKMDLSKHITLAMTQTVTRILSTSYKDKKKQAQLRRFIEVTSSLFVDEIHEYTSTKRRSMIKKFKNVDYLITLSATPYKSSSPIENLKLKATIGKIIYEIKESELIEKNVITESRVFLLLFNHHKKKINQDEDSEVTRYHGVRDNLVFMNDKRDMVLINLIQCLEEQNYKTLVIFSSVKHGKKIESEGGWRFISGTTKSQEREIVKNEFLLESGKVLLASDIFKKGITLPQVEVFINADGGLEDTLIIQRRGRVTGKTKDKDRSLIIDIFDMFEEYLSEHSENRLSVYEETNGPDQITGFDTEDKGWLKNVMREVNTWMRGKRN